MTKNQLVRVKSNPYPWYDPFWLIFQGFIGREGRVVSVDNTKFPIGVQLEGLELVRFFREDNLENL